MKPIIAALLQTLSALSFVIRLITLPLVLTAGTVVHGADGDPDTSEQDTAEPGTPSEEDSTSTPVIPVRAVPYPDAERHESLLEHMALHQRSQEVITLVGDNDSFYGLFLREQSGRPQGGALILHDLAQHGHWPELVAPLREDLPEYGWTTLAIELPAVPVERLPPRKPTSQPSSQAEQPSSPESGDTDQDSTDENSDPENSDPDNSDLQPDPSPEEPETDSDTGLTTEQKQEAYAGSITAHLRSGLDYLASRGQLNSVLIAHGDSAVWAALAVQARQRDTENARGMALILVDAREHPLSALRLTQVLETLEIPVLDILTADARSTQWQDKQRLGTMKRKHRDTYQQIRLSSASADSITVLRRIRGWLKTHAAGTELP